MKIEKLFEFCIKHDIEVRISSDMSLMHRVICLKFIDHRRSLAFAQDIDVDMLNALVSNDAALDNLLKEVEFRLCLSGGEECR